MAVILRQYDSVSLSWIRHCWRVFLTYMDVCHVGMFGDFVITNAVQHFSEYLWLSLGYGD